MNTAPDQKSLEQHLIVKSLKDEAFRHLLVTNPRAAFEQELGCPLPNDVEIVVHQESPRQIHLVLPALPTAAKDTLSDDDLRVVAGANRPKTTGGHCSGTIGCSGMTKCSCGCSSFPKCK